MIRKAGSCWARSKLPRMRERHSTDSTCSRSREAVIRKIDPETGEVLATIPAPGGGGDSGLAWAEGTLWVGQHRGRKIHQVDPETGAVLRTIESDRFVTGVTWVDGELWHGTWQDEKSDVRRIDPATGEVLERLDMPAGTGVSGLESDGGDRFFCGGGTQRKGESHPPTKKRRCGLLNDECRVLPKHVFNSRDWARSSALFGSSSMTRSLTTSDYCSPGQRQCIFDGHAEIPHCFFVVWPSTIRSAQSLPVAL